MPLWLSRLIQPSRRQSKYLSPAPESANYLNELLPLSISLP